MSGAKFKTVLIGFGAIAEGLGNDARMATHFRYATHAQVLRDHPAFDWQAVVDPADTARQRAATDWGIADTALSTEDLKERASFEAAVIATPPGTRLAAIQALPALKAVMVEKPLGTEGPALVAHCEDHGILLQVNHWRRGDALMGSLATGDLARHIGDVQACFATYGNGLANNASHLVDALRLLLGDVITVRALGAASAAPEPAAAGDHSLAFALTFQNGVIANIQPLNFQHYREISIDLWGTTGRLQINQEGLAVTRHPVAENRGLDGAHEVASDASEKLVVTVGEALYRLYDNLAAAASGRTVLMSSGDSAITNEAILRAALQSADQDGAPIIPA